MNQGRQSLAGRGSSGRHKRIHLGKGPAQEDLCERRLGWKDLPSQPVEVPARPGSLLQRHQPCQGGWAPPPTLQTLQEGALWPPHWRNSNTCLCVGSAPALPRGGALSPALQQAQGAGACRLPSPGLPSSPASLGLITVIIITAAVY